MAHHTLSLDAGSFARAAIFHARSIDERTHQRLETFHTRTNHVIWQEGYFDHRLRDDERGEELSAKMNYIRENPVVAGLCAKAEDWRWVIDPFVRERDRKSV